MYDSLERKHKRETIMRWFGRVRRKYVGCIGRRVLRMELPRNTKWESGGRGYGSG